MHCMSLPKIGRLFTSHGSSIGSCLRSGLKCLILGGLVINAAPVHLQANDKTIQASSVSTLLLHTGETRQSPDYKRIPREWTKLGPKPGADFEGANPDDDHSAFHPGGADDDFRDVYDELYPNDGNHVNGDGLQNENRPPNAGRPIRQGSQPVENNAPAWNQAMENDLRGHANPEFNDLGAQPYEPMNDLHNPDFWQHMAENIPDIELDDEAWIGDYDEDFPADLWNNGDPQGQRVNDADVPEDPLAPKTPEHQEAGRPLETEDDLTSTANSPQTAHNEQNVQAQGEAGPKQPVKEPDVLDTADSSRAAEPDDSFWHMDEMDCNFAKRDNELDCSHGKSKARPEADGEPEQSGSAGKEEKQGGGAEEQNSQKPSESAPEAGESPTWSHTEDDGSSSIEGALADSAEVGAEAGMEGIGTSGALQAVAVGAGVVVAAGAASSPFEKDKHVDPDPKPQSSSESSTTTRTFMLHTEQLPDFSAETTLARDPALAPTFTSTSNAISAAPSPPADSTPVASSAKPMYQAAGGFQISIPLSPWIASIPDPSVAHSSSSYLSSTETPFTSTAPYPNALPSSIKSQTLPSYTSERPAFQISSPAPILPSTIQSIPSTSPAPSPSTGSISTQTIQPARKFSPPVAGNNSTMTQPPPNANGVAEFNNLGHVPYIPKFAAVAALPNVERRVA